MFNEISCKKYLIFNTVWTLKKPFQTILQLSCFVVSLVFVSILLCNTEDLEINFLFWCIVYACLGRQEISSLDANADGLYEPNLNCHWTVVGEDFKNIKLRLIFFFDNHPPFSPLPSIPPTLMDRANGNIDTTFYSGRI